MPELPEVETLRLHLEPHLVDTTLIHIDVLNTKQLIGDIHNAIGQKVISINRVGKVMMVNFENSYILHIHLKMSGQLLFSPNKFARIILIFNKDGAETKLYFCDIRKFGWVKISNKKEVPKGVDVTTKEFTREYFWATTQSTSRDIKTLLLDQNKLSGVGNIYDCDALWIAQIYPFTPSNMLTRKQSDTLHSAIVDVIQEGIERKGSSKTLVYRLPNGESGSYQNFFKVYSKEGKPCSRCSAVIVRVKKQGRSTFYCPTCQK
jgi:formamidopyrimidine-DNA glycosylase